ncbi:TOMM precursor leader peptide-binding protein [Streptosporangium sp. NBC_01756]|uniref:TOMM precursor leader peptide-binding protein n=1 Tax=Streptosporangium sp. NBC_01756 TaxID=2975950 RepID=UPI002DD9949D|nr:TOMM precursor leader peptide-binding protein [Streptosporangium sp. NBC_01756]WSC85352.1 TOMM precursor leader peptide-binding protein [Streptosporangium sp. NBC_01756]
MESRRTGAPRIAFKRHVRVEPVPGGAVYLVSPAGTFALSGTHARAVAALLDGTRTLAEVREALTSTCSSEELGQMLGRLSKANLIGFRHSSGTRDTEAQAYWDLAGFDGDHVDLGRASVDIVRVGKVDAEHVEEACRAMGLSRGDGAGAVDLSLVFCDDYLDQELDEINRRHLALGRAWLPAVTSGAVHWIGPVFDSKAGPCWSCLASRLHERRQGESCVRRELGGTGSVRPPPASLPATRMIGIQSVVLQAAKWLAGERDDLSSILWTLDTTTLESRRHIVERRPQCPSCGDPEMVAARARVPLVVRPRLKATSFELGNGHRSLSAEQVWERYGHLADPVTGVTGEIRRDSRAPSFLHCYLAGHNRALRSDRLDVARAGLRSRSGGKGAGDTEAKVGALCEAVERYSASRFGDEEAVLDTLRGLGSQALHPNDYQLFHPRQFSERERWNAAHMSFHHVPEPFDETAAVEWTPVWSLTTGRHRFLPTEVLYFHGDAARSRLWADSNGNAAGSSLEDAIVQGFLELVERDAVALWWYNRTRQPAVDLASFDDVWITDLRERYAEVGRRLWVLDLSTDLDIPAMAAISQRVDKPAEDIMLGFGAHFDPRVAARRALTELGQLLPAVAGVKADGTGYGVADPHLLDWWQSATTAAHTYLLPDPLQSSRRRSDYQYVPRADLRDDIDHIRSVVSRMGSELLILDQTRPDIGMPVVKVIVPGLRHFWARFAEGRLYDVPVRLGRLEKATLYDELNPIPLFL